MGLVSFIGGLALGWLGSVLVGRETTTAPPPAAQVDVVSENPVAPPPVDAGPSTKPEDTLLATNWATTSDPAEKLEIERALQMGAAGVVDYLFPVWEKGGDVASDPVGWFAGETEGVCRMLRGRGPVLLGVPLEERPCRSLRTTPPRMLARRERHDRKLGHLYELRYFDVPSSIEENRRVPVDAVFYAMTASAYLPSVAPLLKVPDWNVDDAGEEPLEEGELPRGYLFRSPLDLAALATSEVRPMSILWRDPSDAERARFEAHFAKPDATELPSKLVRLRVADSYWTSFPMFVASLDNRGVALLPDAEGATSFVSGGIHEPEKPGTAGDNPYGAGPHHFQTIDVGDSLAIPGEPGAYLVYAERTDDSWDTETGDILRGGSRSPAGRRGARSRRTSSSCRSRNPRVRRPMPLLSRACPTSRTG